MMRTYYAIPFGERYIWGVTAGILRNLYEKDLRRMIRPVLTEILLFVDAVRDLRAVPVGDARGRAQAGIVAAADRRRAHHRRDRAGADRLLFPRAVPWRAGRAPTTFRRIWKTANSFPGSSSDGDCRPAGQCRMAEQRARCRACWTCSTATARRRAWSAARSATRCSGKPIGEIDIATTAMPEEVMRRADAAGFKAVPTGIEHGTVMVVVQRYAVRSHDVARRMSRPMAARPRSRSAATGRVDARAPRFHDERPVRCRATAACTIMSAGLPI